MVEKFNYYDAIAHLIPGTIGCLFLFYTFEVLSIELPKPNVGSLEAVGIGIVLAYTVGHLLQSIASSIEPLFYVLWGGKPSIRLLVGATRQFSEEQRRQLVEDLVRFFKVREECPKDLKGSQSFYQRLFERCMALCNRNNLGRVDAFNANYGFHRVLLTTFLLGFFAYLTVLVARHCGWLEISSMKIPLLKSLILLSGIGAGIEVFRARKRAYYYAREVLWMTSDYMRASSSSPEQSKS